MRTSYLPNEILWGYRFEHSCVAYDQKAAKYVVSVNNLNRVLADNMTPRWAPLISWIKFVPQELFKWKMSHYCNWVLHFKEKDEFQVCQWHCYDRCSAKDYNERRLSRKSMSSSPSGSGSPGNSLEEGEEEEEVGVGSNFNFSEYYRTDTYFFTFLQNISKYYPTDISRLLLNIFKYYPKFWNRTSAGQTDPNLRCLSINTLLEAQHPTVALCKWYKPVTLHLFCHFLWYFIANTYTRYSFNHSYLVVLFLFLSTSVKQ